MTNPNSTTTSSQPPIQRRARLAGFPGENQGVLAVVHYIDTGTKAHLNAHGPAGLPGMYTVEFVLARPDARNAPENEFRFADQRRGDSHLAVAKPAVIIDIDPTEMLLHFQSPSSPALVFHGFPQRCGLLGQAEKVILSTHQIEVTLKKSRLPPCEALLSGLSAQLDIPLIIELVEVIELGDGWHQRHHFHGTISGRRFGC